MSIVSRLHYVPQVLRQLTADGIISRELFPDVPPRTEYSVWFTASSAYNAAIPATSDALKQPIHFFKTSFGLILSNLSIILIMSMTSHIGAGCSREDFRER